MRYEARNAVKWNKDASGMLTMVPGSGKLLGSFKRHQDAQACITRHRKKFPRARECAIVTVMGGE